MRLECRKRVTVRQPRETVQETQVSDAVESLDDLRPERVVQIEQQVAVAGKPIGEEHPARTELVLGVMRPQSLFTNGRGGDDRSVTVALGRKIDDREEIAVLTTLVANPCKEIT